MSCPVGCGEGTGRLIAFETRYTVQFCFHREDAWACITEQLCYSCRVNMKDLVSDCPICPWDLSPWSHGFSHSISCSPPWTHCHPTS